jgi:phosphoglucosamine mutase
VDCAHGAASQIGPEVLRLLGAEVIPLNNQPDGTNINENCGSLYPAQLQQAVLTHRAVLGIAYDGDADRVIAVDEQGELVDGDQIMVICGLHLKRLGCLAGNTVVVTVMSNLGLHLAFEKNHIQVRQTPVGDRYVLEEMRSCGAILGGEQSGHIIFRDQNTTGDGIMTTIQLLSVMVETGCSLAELAGQMQRLPQVLVNVRIKDKTKIDSSPGLALAISRAQAKLGKEGRILVRPSGTEPLVRIMAEGPCKEELEQIVADLVREAEEKL